MGGLPRSWVWCGQRGGRRAEKWRGPWASGGGGGCPWPRHHGADSRTCGRGQCPLEASGRPCPLVAGGGKAAIGCHVGDSLGREVLGEAPALGSPLLAGQHPHPQHDIHVSQWRLLPATFPSSVAAPRCLTFCLLVPAKHSLGISTSGPLLKPLVCSAWSAFPSHAHVSQTSRPAAAPPRPRLSPPAPQPSHSQEGLDLIFLMTRSLCGWKGSASSLGSPH